jgi:pSer/pThr/pTyr-binding forkhead associated (FHA) protein
VNAGGNSMQINLLMVKKDGTGKEFPLPSKVTIIGRRHDCDLRIPLSQVSKRHCQLNLDNGILKVRDLGSRNGTILNGKKIDESEVLAGDCIEVGPLKFVFQIDGEPAEIGKQLSTEKPQEQPKEPEASADDTHVVAGELEGDFDSLLNEFDVSDDETEDLLSDLDLSS